MSAIIENNVSLSDLSSDKESFDSSKGSNSSTQKLHHRRKRLPTARKDLSHEFLFPTNIIDEDPELNSAIQNSNAELNAFQKLTQRITTTGSLFRCIIDLIVRSPVIIILFLPYAIHKVGFFYSVMIIFLPIAVCSYFTSFLILKVQFTTRVNNYENLLLNHFSNLISNFYHFTYLFFSFGLGVLDLYVFLAVFINFLQKKSVSMDSKPIIKLLILLGGYIFISFPSVWICNSLGDNLFKGVRFIIYILSLLISIILNLIEDNATKSNFNVELYSPLNYYFPLLLSMMIIAFTNHPNIFRELEKLNMPVLKRGKSLVIYSTLWQLVIFLIIALLCLFFKLNDEGQKGDSMMLLTKGDINTFVSFLSLIVNILLSVFCQINIAIGFSNIFNSYNIIYKGNNNIMKKVLSSVFILFANIIAFWSENYKLLELVFALIGGFSGIMLGFLFPGYFYLKTETEINKKEKLFTQFIMTLMPFFGIIILVTSFLSYFNIILDNKDLNN